MNSPQSSPPLRKTTANVLTPLGWLHGTFQIPQYQSMLDFLAPTVQVIKFTRVLLPNEKESIAFVGLRRESVIMIEPTQPDEPVEAAGSIGRSTPRKVGCLLEAGMLRGTLEVLVNVRVSDYLRQQPGFVVLRQCVLTPYGEGPTSPKARRIQTAVVNLARAIGVSEWEGRP